MDRPWETVYVRTDDGQKAVELHRRGVYVLGPSESWVGLHKLAALLNWFEHKEAVNELAELPAAHAAKRRTESGNP